MFCFVLILFVFLFQFSPKAVAVLCHLSSVFFLLFHRFTIYCYCCQQSRTTGACVRACLCAYAWLSVPSFASHKFFFFLHGFELIYVFNHLPFWWLCQVLCVESLLVPHSITFSFRYIVFIQLLSVIFFLFLFLSNCKCHR